MLLAACRVTGTVKVGETVAAIVEAHRSGATSPEATIARTYARIRAHGDPAVFISLRDEADARAEAKAMAARHAKSFRSMACRSRSRTTSTSGACRPPPPVRPSPMSRQGRDRGRAAPAGRRHRHRQDQSRSIRHRPGRRALALWHAAQSVRSGADPRRLELAARRSRSRAGLVPLALGTDTAGSGRVPAGLNNIVGLKPSLGLVSTAGVVPACRTLDCVSVFALTIDDAFAALAAMAGPDAADPYSRAAAARRAWARCRAGMRIGVPLAGPAAVLRRHGDRPPPTRRALARLAGLGAAIVEIDIEPFYETARLLYDGPWVAERYITARSLHRVARRGDASGHPRDHSRRRAADRGRRLRGVLPARGAAARARSHLRRHRRAAACRRCRPSTPSSRCWPIRSSSTAGSAPTPISSTCSTCAALAVPAAMQPTARRSASRCWRRPARTRVLASIGRVFHADTGLPLGRDSACRSRRSRRLPTAPPAGEIAIAVVGAHLSGMPLNGELNRWARAARGGRTTAPDYRLFALAGTDAGEAGPAAGRRRPRRRHRRRDLGDAGRAVRPLRRGDPGAAVDRHDRGWPTAAA